MFAWARKMWSGGEVPDRPLNSDLDFPDEEEWYFDYEAWKWKNREKQNQNVYDEYEELIPDVVVDVMDLTDEPAPQCCGGSCHLPAAVVVPEPVVVPAPVQSSTPAYEPTHFDYSPPVTSHWSAPSHTSHDTHSNHDSGHSCCSDSGGCDGGGDGGGGGD